MSSVEGLASELRAEARAVREAAIDKIVNVAVRDRDYDRAHRLLRARWVGPDGDPDHAIWETLRSAIRCVLLARGRVRGLRNAAPDILPADPERLVWAAIELVFDAASIYDGPAVLDDALALATPEQRGVHAIWWTQSEVRDGGFEQFFGNSTAIVWPHLVEGLARIGAHQTAGVVARAAAIFPNDEVPRDHKTRVLLLDRLDLRRLYKIDDAFYALLDTELWPQLTAFVRRHRSAFFE